MVEVDAGEAHVAVTGREETSEFLAILQIVALEDIDVLLLLYLLFF